MKWVAVILGLSALFNASVCSEVAGGPLERSRIFGHAETREPIASPPNAFEHEFRDRPSREPKIRFKNLAKKGFVLDGPNSLYCNIIPAVISRDLFKITFARDGKGQAFAACTERVPPYPFGISEINKTEVKIAGIESARIKFADKYPHSGGKPSCRSDASIDGSKSDAWPFASTVTPSQLSRVNVNIGTRLVPARVASNPVGLKSNAERKENQDGPDTANGYLRDCEVFLPLTGCGTSSSSVGRSPLLYQIFLLIGVGFIFAIPGTLSVFWTLDNANWQRKLIGSFVFCLSLSGTLFFYAWAFYAHPLGFLRAYVGG
jgi:hypothetical protein